jgi:outer membrane protein OmpA-like peptidoglycan-associated protein
LLDSQAPGLGERMQEIEAFERNTPAGGGQAIDAARSARSGCLKVLTHLRRPKTAEAQAAGAAEALLEQVGRRGTLLPVRDDRGVVVTLRDMFQQNTKFAQQATEVIGFLAGVARENPSFPVLVVAHEPRASKLAAERAQAVASALEKAGAPSVAFESARADQPVVDPRKPGAAQKNARIEVVFVAPAH